MRMTAAQMTELFIRTAKEQGVPDEWYDPADIERHFADIIARQQKS